MKRIIPNKVLLLFIALFVFAIPIIGYLVFSLFILLIMWKTVPIWYFYLGLITSIVILIFVLCSKEQYGIIFKEDKLLYADYSIKPGFDAWELEYDEISAIEYKTKGDIFEPRRELTNKNIIILTINNYQFKYLDLSLYSNRQIKLILKELQSKIHHS